ncbi:UDP-2,3-diacylglucosamine diphosphatase [Acidisoma sp. C75]
MNDVPRPETFRPETFRPETFRQEPYRPEASRARSLGAPVFRSIFISDLHLGTRGSKAAMLHAFLESASCERLYLVGDIIDGWRLRRSWFWDAHHDAVLRDILRLARHGTEVIYIPGNHDEMMRAWLPMGLEIAGIRLMEEAVHETADGKRLLVIHGDFFDSVVRCAKFLALLGDQAYTAALVLNGWFNRVRRYFGYPYWSLSAWLKRQVKEAVKFIDSFETTLAQEARKRQMDGVICGHIHHAEMRMIGETRYFNTGDWVESCTALVEHHDGRFELIDWPSRLRQSARAADQLLADAAAGGELAEAAPLPA